MSTQFAPIGAVFSVYINGVLVGGVESYEITMQSDCRVIRSVGSPLPVQIAKGEMGYGVRLRHLLHDKSTLPIFRAADIWYPFELRIEHETWTETLTDCLCTGVTQHGETGQTVYEELTCVAESRKIT